MLRVRNNAANNKLLVECHSAFAWEVLAQQVS